MQLHELQKSFIKSIKDDSTEIFSEILETPILSRNRRVEIYKNAYEIRIYESLKEDFPQLRMACGDLEPLIKTFLQSNVSTSFTLAALSESFRNFVKQNYAEFSRVVDLDFAILTAGLSSWPLLFMKLSGQILTADEISSLNPDQIEVVWNSSLQLLDDSGQLVYFNQNELSIRNATQKEILLLKRRSNIRGLLTLVEGVAAIDVNPEEAHKLIEELTKSGLMYFVRANLSEKNK